VRVAHRHDHAREPGAGHERRAGRRAADVRAGLEGHVERRSARPLARPGQGLDLGVRAARALVESLAHHAAALHDHAAHDRVRIGLAEAPRSQEKGAPHPPDVVAHLGQPTRLSAKAAGSKGSRLSIVSPTPTYRMGTPSSRTTATATPPFAVPSSFVSTRPVTLAAFANSRPWARP